jgi:hypothetical protein
MNISHTVWRSGLTLLREQTAWFLDSMIARDEKVSKSKNGSTFGFIKLEPLEGDGR